MGIEIEPALSCGRADKRDAILNGAFAVFAEDGYTRAGIGGIAERAGVSTRTIYNHFRNKAELFYATISASTTKVGDAQLAVIDRHFRRITDLEADLNAFGVEFTRALQPFAEHFAMMTQVKAERAHIPAEATENWYRLGPGRVFAAMAEQLTELDRAGLLHVADAHRAGRQLLMLLLDGAPGDSSLDPKTPDAIAATVAAGVKAFLYGHAAGR